MSNTAGYNSVEKSLPLEIIPNYPTQPFTGTNELFRFQEHMYGENAANEEVILDIQFHIFETNFFQFPSQSRDYQITGQVIVDSAVFNIIDGISTLYPFAGSYTSAVFFQYRLNLELKGEKYFFYGEKTAKPWTFGLGLIQNCWRIWENLSSQKCWIYRVSRNSNQLELVHSLELKIRPLEYPKDQIFGIRTITSNLLFSILIILWWFFVLTFNILRTHVNSNCREITNYWTSKAGLFKDDRYSNWDNSFHIAVSRENFLKPANVQEVHEAVARVRAAGKNASLRLVGSGHTFHPDLLSPDNHFLTAGQRNNKIFLLELSNMRRILKLNLKEEWVEVEGGIQLRRLVEVLHDHGLTLGNHGAYLVQTIAGALSTGTHGTSGRFTKLNDQGTPSILEAVLSGEFITETGIVALTPQNIVTLGLVGVLVKVRLRVEKINYLRQKQVWTPVSRINYYYLQTLLYDQRNKFVEIRGPTEGTHAAVYLYQDVDSISPLQTIYNFYLRYGLVLLYELAAYRVPVWFYRFSYALLTIFLSYFPQIDVNSWALTKDYAPPHEETEWAIDFDNEYDVERALQVLQEVVNNNNDPIASSLSGEYHLRFDIATKSWLAPSFGRRTLYIDLNYPISNPAVRITRIYQNWQSALQAAVASARPHWSKRYDIQQVRQSLPNLYPSLRDFRQFVSLATLEDSIFHQNSFVRSTQLLTN